MTLIPGHTEIKEHELTDQAEKSTGHMLLILAQNMNIFEI